jgi:hypothetical protein
MSTASEMDGTTMLPAGGTSIEKRTIRKKLRREVGIRA